MDETKTHDAEETEMVVIVNNDNQKDTNNITEETDGNSSIQKNVIDNIICSGFPNKSIKVR